MCSSERVAHLLRILTKLMVQATIVEFLVWETDSGIWRRLPVQSNISNQKERKSDQNDASKPIVDKTMSS